jgi:hypothetical protein
MSAGRPKKLNVGAFIALMAEMGVEAVPLPGGEPGDNGEEGPPSEGTESE